MTPEEIKTIIENQRIFFKGGETLPVRNRIKKLRKLKESILSHEAEINDALKSDLGKSAFESYMTETGMVLSELTHMIKNIYDYTERKDVPTPRSQFSAKSYQKSVPYGVVLIISPWNYPFHLAMIPLIDAVSAGNTVVLKVSANAPATSQVTKLIIEECFDKDWVQIITEDREECSNLLEHKFDYIFFTGSKNTGKTVMSKAATNLTPVTLELGGKSPCIVDRKCNIKLAARRIVFGKFINCGQTCVAPDYIYCHKKIKDKLIKQLKVEIQAQYTATPLINESYGKIINTKQFNRLLGLIAKDKVIHGGASNPDNLKIEPTLIDNVTFEDPIMKEEIFGPLMPIVTFDKVDEAIDQINSMDHPLALYVFTSRNSVARKFIDQCGFGGGCINDTLVHLATSEMGFGGFGESGMGSYHGEAGFRTFTHYKSIVKKRTWIDTSIRYQPYKDSDEKKLRRFLK